MREFKNWTKWEVWGGIAFIFLFFSFYTFAVRYFSPSPEWINYYGSVLGAIISISVIALTIRQNKKHHIDMMNEQEKKHTELKLLQVETALHAKKQERLRGVIADLKHIYSTTSPYKITALVMMSKLQDRNTTLLMLSDYTKSVSLVRDTIDLMTHTNKDIIDISELNNQTNNYLVFFAENIAKISTQLFLNKQIDEITPFLDSFSNSEAYQQYRIVLFKTITVAQEKIDNKLLQQSTPTNF